MSRRLGHPDPEALACFRAGMVSERRGRRLSAHVSRCPRCAVTCARLDAVVAALANASVPVLPSAAQRRVISAIDAESGARASGATAPVPAMRLSVVEADPALPDRLAVAPLAPAASGHRRRWAWQRTAPSWLARSWVARSWAARVGVTACLVASIAGLGYLVRGAGAGSPVRAIPTSPASQRSGPYLPAYPPGGGQAPQGEPGQPDASSRTIAFLVTDTGTKYRRSTLRAQVRVRLAAHMTPPAVEPIQPVLATSASGSTPSPQPPASTGSQQPANPPASAEVTPPQSLIGCVLHLTGNVPPEFVDRATYQARPAYVFAAADEAWVVGIDCTAARPALITAVRLGNAS